MKFTRRKILTLGVGAVGAGIFYRVIEGYGIAAHALNVVKEVYGDEFADQQAAIEFAGAYEAFVLQKGMNGKFLNLAYIIGVGQLPYVKNMLARIDGSVIDKFAMSTNVILAAEQGLPLVFVSIFDPYNASCLNQLGAKENT